MVKLVPRIDHRFQGVPQADVQNDQGRKRLIKMKLMDELLISNNHEYKPMSECAKDFMKSQGNIEDFELCELSRKVQCEHCLKQVAEGHVYCECGKQLPEALTRGLVTR